MGGRSILIHSVFDAMPTYTMSIFPIPVHVLNRIGSVRRNYTCKETVQDKVPPGKVDISHYQ